MATKLNPVTKNLLRLVILIALTMLAAACQDSSNPKEQDDAPPAAGEMRPDEPAGEQAAEVAPVSFQPELVPNAQQLTGEFNSIANAYEHSRSPYLGYGMVERYQSMATDQSLSEEDRMQSRLELVRQLLKDGDVDRALEEMAIIRKWLDSVDTLAVFGDAAQERGALASSYWVEGLAWLRKAEVENCIARNNADCCIFPLAGGGLHEVDTPARNAMKAYSKYLEYDPGNDGGIWLLNIAAMAADQWPDGLPADVRIPRESFSDDSGFPRFENVSSRLGIDSFDLCGGTIVDDFNGDGLPDIVSSTFDFNGSLKYFENDGQGGFTDRAQASGLALQKGGLNCIGADYDNDGDLDILVLRGAWLMDDGLVRNSLLRNNGDGTFSDVTRAAGMQLPGRPTQAACWHDFDNDGWLDLYEANESRRVIEKEGPSYPARLWVSNRDGSFTERAAEAGCLNDEYGKGVSAGDFDNDGLVDIFVSNVGHNRLYRNLGGLQFEEVSDKQGVGQPESRSFVPWFFDQDNDGWLDLFVGSYDSSIEDLSRYARGIDKPHSTPLLYRNLGNGSYRLASAELGLDMPVQPMGANFGDIDNDGWLDMYLATGDPEFETLMPNIMLQNLGGQAFRNITFSGGFGHLQKGHGVAFVDIDNDGDQDIYHQLGGFYPGDKFANALFLNPGNANHWLKIRLNGVQTNRQGYGVRIRLKLATPNGEREVHRAVGSVSSFGGSPRTQEIGLGDATAITELELYWPVSGTRQLFRDVPLDTLVLVSEDADQWEGLELHPISFE
ncbi:MAG: CRTAC1 family protein [Planctomycetales bacterium]|nr:CRTAC1 family protein [bacterium]UNM08012.1 MAG: CRTAC1 family protein [Planctomycetales bacterium]